jgi:hypothetical protein
MRDYLLFWLTVVVGSGRHPDAPSIEQSWQTDSSKRDPVTVLAAVRSSAATTGTIWFGFVTPALCTVL